MYNIKTTKPSKFLDPKIFYIDNFYIDTSIIILEM